MCHQTLQIERISYIIEVVQLYVQICLFLLISLTQERQFLLFLLQSFREQLPSIDSDSSCLPGMCGHMQTSIGKALFVFLVCDDGDLTFPTSSSQSLQQHHTAVRLYLPVQGRPQEICHLSGGCSLLVSRCLHRNSQTKEIVRAKRLVSTPDQSPMRKHYQCLHGLSSTANTMAHTNPK